MIAMVTQETTCLLRMHKFFTHGLQQQSDSIGYSTVIGCAVTNGDWKSPPFSTQSKIPVSFVLFVDFRFSVCVITYLL